MKKIIVALFVVALFSCNKKRNDKPESIKETSVSGATTILVDESVYPIIEDLVIVFESEYKRAKIKLVSKSETEILNMIRQDKARIAILAKSLDSVEIKEFNKKQIYPRITEFATDAIAFIANRQVADSTVNQKDIADVLNKKKSNRITALVFDNPNSSSVRNLKSMANVKELPSDGVFSAQSSEEVVKHVSENKGSIGIVGVNWLLQPSAAMEPYLEKIKVLGVDNVKLNAKNKYIKPNQTNIADGSYPVTRKIFLLNFQGTTGLGMGFASYIAGDKGQRVILKSGLVPTRFPSREIAVRNKVENNK